MSSQDPLSMWTVYDHPSDFPDHYVARRFEIQRGGAFPTDSIIMDHDLEAIRAELAEMGYTLVTRSPEDEHHIIESWV